ncbi:hypothetical protein BD289DRAFT_447896 [Coniella lustricola]|uniref:Uncharacterized protein n=1 Tax=Coniella lustricola TaxID=2025994 RepID=A0A2T2ZSM9_9PEZI|nr:hypothetical protein BD289DRAFT_447896 [Coniella lustricola]
MGLGGMMAGQPVCLSVCLFMLLAIPYWGAVWVVGKEEKTALQKRLQPWRTTSRRRASGTATSVAGTSRSSLATRRSGSNLGGSNRSSQGLEADHSNDRPTTKAKASSKLSTRTSAATRAGRCWAGRARRAPQSCTSCSGWTQLHSWR